MVGGGEWVSLRRRWLRRERSKSTRKMTQRYTTPKPFLKKKKKSSKSLTCYLHCPTPGIYKRLKDFEEWRRTRWV